MYLHDPFTTLSRRCFLTVMLRFFFSLAIPHIISHPGESTVSLPRLWTVVPSSRVVCVVVVVVVAAVVVDGIDLT